MKTINFFPFLFLSLFTLFLFSSCEGDYRRAAQGGFSEILVVMDSTKWDTPPAQALRETFGKKRMSLPQPEPRYDLRFLHLGTNRDLEYAKNFKNTIFIAPINEESNVASFIRGILSPDIQNRILEGKNFAFPVKDRWYRDQWTLFLSAPDEKVLADKIYDSSSSLIDYLDKIERERWTRQVYRRGEQKELSEELMQNHGFSFRVQHDYRIGVDTTDFVSLRRYLHDNDRWIWIWYKDDVDGLESYDTSRIHELRDSLMMQYIRGTREESYVKTEYRRPFEKKHVTINGLPSIEIRGTWQMAGDMMGGPFLHYTLYDPNKRRLYMLEFGQFAPRYQKRRFVNQFEAMAYTFVTDATKKNKISSQ